VRCAWAISVSGKVRKGQQGQLGCAGAVVGDAEHAIADGHVAHALADLVDDPGDVRQAAELLETGLASLSRSTQAGGRNGPG